MADKTIEKRKFIWKITNFTREAVNKYKERESVESENFEIWLGDFGDNMTKWNFCFNPKKENCCEFYIHKFAVDQDDFLIKLDVAIQKPDNITANIHCMEIASNVIQLGDGRGWKFLKHASIFKTEKKYLANDTLTLIINLELHQEDGGPLAKKSRLYIAQPEWIVNHFNSEDLSDVTIICSDKKSIPAHRFVLASRSSVFKAMLTTDMAEKKSNKITVAEDSETMMEFMRFIYTQEVQDLKKHASQLLDCAEKYDVPDLKLICVQKLTEELSDKNIFETILLAKLYNERKLMRKCMDYIDTHFSKLKETEELKKIDSDLLISIMNFMQEKLKGIELTNSL